MNHPEIAAQLEKLWQSANTDTRDALIDKDEYVVMHRKIVLSIDPTTTPRQAQEQAEQDWVRDSDGKPGLDRKRFYWTWFELADLYTKSLEPEHYVRFLNRILRTITKVGPGGATQWQDDRKIIELHYERLRSKGKARDVDGSMPAVMSTWHKFLQDEKERERKRKEEQMIRLQTESAPRGGAPASAPPPPAAAPGTSGFAAAGRRGSVVAGGASGRVCGGAAPGAAPPGAAPFFETVGDHTRPQHQQQSTAGARGGAGFMRVAVAIGGAPGAEPSAFEGAPAYAAYDGGVPRHRSARRGSVGAAMMGRLEAARGGGSGPGAPGWREDEAVRAPPTSPTPLMEPLIASDPLAASVDHLSEALPPPPIDSHAEAGEPYWVAVAVPGSAYASGTCGNLVPGAQAGAGADPNDGAERGAAHRPRLDSCDRWSIASDSTGAEGMQQRRRSVSGDSGGMKWGAGAPPPPADSTYGDPEGAVVARRGSIDTNRAFSFGTVPRFQGASRPPDAGQLTAGLESRASVAPGAKGNFGSELSGGTWSASPRFGGGASCGGGGKGGAGRDHSQDGPPPPPPRAPPRPPTGGAHASMAYTDPRFRDVHAPQEATPGPGAYEPQKASPRGSCVRPRSAPGRDSKPPPTVKPTAASTRREAPARREAIRAVIRLRPSYRLDVPASGGGVGYGDGRGVGYGEEDDADEGEWAGDGEEDAVARTAQKPSAAARPSSAPQRRAPASSALAGEGAGVATEAGEGDGLAATACMGEGGSQQAACEAEPLPGGDAPKEAADVHRRAPKLSEPPPHASTRSMVAQALATARDDIQKLQVLRTVLLGGHRQWWALPMVLDSRCSARIWEDDTAVRFAYLIFEAAATASSLESRHAMVGALRPHPMLTALVAMIASDAPAMLEAGRRCSASELRQLSRIALSSVARDEGRPAGELDLNMSLWFSVCRDLELEKAVGATGGDKPLQVGTHAAAAGSGGNGGLLRMAAVGPPKPSPRPTRRAAPLRAPGAAGREPAGTVLLGGGAQPLALATGGDPHLRPARSAPQAGAPPEAPPGAPPAASAAAPRVRARRRA